MMKLQADEKGNVTVSLEELIQFSVAQGMAAYKACMKEEQKADEKEKHDKKLHSTKLLMEHYREFKQHEENAVSDLYTALSVSDDIYDILGVMQGYGKNPSANKVESIEKSAFRTKMIMAHVDSMLAVYQKNCEGSQVPELVRRYRVVIKAYVAQERKSVEQIAEEECCDIATVYRDKKKALEDLAALIFGIDGIKLMKK